MAFRPYLFFGGNCREAFTRYQEIFGGELTLMTMADAPPEAAPPSEQADLIMHAALKFGDNLLMASDDPTGDRGPKTGMAVNYTTPDADQAKRIFEGLADGGQVSMPFEKAPWGDYFGQLTDKFGVSWMFDVGPADAVEAETAGDGAGTA